MSETLQRRDACSPYEALKAQAAARPHAIFLQAPALPSCRTRRDGFAYRYGEALARIEALRRAYAAAGYGRGACVALLLENRPEYFWHWLALNGLGVSILPINPDLRADDLAYQLSIAEPDLAVALADRHALIAKAWGTGAHHRARREHRRTCRANVTRQTRRAQRSLRAAVHVRHDGEAEMLRALERLLSPSRPLVRQPERRSRDGRERDRAHAAAAVSQQRALLLGDRHDPQGRHVVPLDRFSARRWWRIV